MGSSPPLGTLRPAGEDVRTPEGGPGNTKEYTAVRARHREHICAKRARSLDVRRCGARDI